MRRHVGVLKVEAIGAQDLKKYDVIGKSDPFLEVFTLPLHKVLTRACSAAEFLLCHAHRRLDMVAARPETQALPRKVVAIIGTRSVGTICATTSFCVPDDHAAAARMLPNDMCCSGTWTTSWLESRI